MVVGEEGGIGGDGGEGIRNKVAITTITIIAIPATAIIGIMDLLFFRSSSPHAGQLSLAQSGIVFPHPG